MSKKVLILSTSLRRGGNSDILADAAAKGAVNAGHEVEKIGLINKSMAFCTGCLACQKSGRCVFHDDADEITSKIQTADVVIFATPVYYYCMSGQMKTMLDRANPLFVADYTFRDIYLLMSAADTDETAAEGTVKALEGWVSCFEKARFAGTVFGGGADAAGDIAGHPAVQAAYELGASV